MEVEAWAGAQWVVAAKLQQAQCSLPSSHPMLPAKLAIDWMLRILAFAFCCCWDRQQPCPCLLQHGVTETGQLTLVAMIASLASLTDQLGKLGDRRQQD